MSAAAKNFTFICGADDFLVDRLGRERFAALVAQSGADDFSRDVLSGFANNVGEVEAAVLRFRDAVQTVPMFGGKRVVWLKDVNFLADSVTGRAESTLTLVADIQALLEKLNPDETAVLVTAAPIDRRRSFPKWCEKNADFVLVGGDADRDSDALAGVALAEAGALGVKLTPDATRLLVEKVGTNTRLLVEEVNKLANAIPEGGTIEEAHVAELTPNVAEGDFFETAEAFFGGNLQSTLDALERHFFSGGDARPVISSLQNRNRILLQLRALAIAGALVKLLPLVRNAGAAGVAVVVALADAGDVKLGPRGADGLPRAAATYTHHYGAAASEKSGYNIFTQNAWYVGKLAPAGKLPPLRRLIDNQQEFIRAFEELIQRPKEQEDVLREMIVRCLAPAA